MRGGKFKPVYAPLVRSSNFSDSTGRKNQTKESFQTSDNTTDSTGNRLHPATLVDLKMNVEYIQVWTPLMERLPPSAAKTDLPYRHHQNASMSKPPSRIATIHDNGRKYHQAATPARGALWLMGSGPLPGTPVEETHCTTN